MATNSETASRRSQVLIAVIW